MIGSLMGKYKDFPNQAEYLLYLVIPVLLVGQYGESSIVAWNNVPLEWRRASNNAAIVF